MFKSGKELEKVKRIIAKYGNKKLQEEATAQEKAIFGTTETISLEESNDDTTCSSSDENEEEAQELLFTLEEIQMLSDADKATYLNKLTGDFKIIQEKWVEVLEKVEVARAEAKEAIKRGEETLANFKSYQNRFDNLMTGMVKNLGYDDKKDRKRVTRQGKAYWAHQAWL
jgi:hypothetical protein